MTQIQKIKAEIDRLQETTMDKNSNFKSQYNQGIFDGLSLIDNFIDSLEEEPVSKNLEKELDKYFSQFKGLEKCYWNWRIDSINIHAQCIYDFAKHFAQWQKERILNNAIEREVKVDAGGYPYIDVTELYDYDKDKPLAKKGDKVKLIIIMEE